MFNESHCAQLERGLNAMEISLPQKNLQTLMAFLAMLLKWNRVYNLSAIKEPEQMVTLHLLDSLAVLPHLHGRRCIDVGTGAGLPGIPLAIARPDIEFVLLDSNSKKTRFIQQACIELKLKNVFPLHERVEMYQPEQKFDTVTARAFTAMLDLLTKTRHLLRENGQLLALKSSETDAPKHGRYRFERVEPLVISDLDAARNLVIYTAI
ncbi:MAG: 16S rRNA methyltransferase G [Cycloclasticus sp. symbiont of Poecilosclerida sp. N]|nr:MAG: 16S rRNA methyltransferase G [Cycloclasticus sp. symbiont of Poecilosclerida sp. N]